MSELNEKCNVGECAKCGSNAIEYGDQDNNMNETWYNYTCTKCGHHGKEIYEMKHIGNE